MSNISSSTSQKDLESSSKKKLKLDWKWKLSLSVYALSLMLMLGFYVAGLRHGEFLFSRVNQGDNGAYFSWFVSIKNGAWTYDNLLTNDLAPYTAVNLWTVLVGKIAAMVGGKLSIAFEISRGIGAVAFIYGICALVELFVQERRNMILVSLFCVFSAGLTGLLRSRGFYDISVTGIDYLQPEANTIRIIYMSPLFALAAGMMLYCVKSFLLFATELNRKVDYWVFLVGVCLANIHPYESIVSLALLCLVYIVVQKSSRRRFVMQLALPWTIVTVLSILVTYGMQKASGAVGLRKDAVMASYGFLQSMIGYGVPLLLALIGALQVDALRPFWKQNLTFKPGWLLLGWFAIQILLSRLPVDFQRRLLVCSEIPIALLAGVTLVCFYESRKVTSKVFAVAAAMLCFPSTLWMLREELIDLKHTVTKPREVTGLLLSGQAEIISKVKQLIPSDGTVQYVGDNDSTLRFFLPALAERHCYATHWMETKDFSEKMAKLQQFLSSASSDEFLKKSKIQGFVYEEPRNIEDKKRLESDLQRLVNLKVLRAPVNSATGQVKLYLPN